MENYPVITFEPIDGLTTIVLGYAWKEDAEKDYKVIFDHEKCYLSKEGDIIKLSFYTPDGMIRLSILFRKATPETGLLLDNKIRHITASYPLEDGQLFYHHVLPIRF